MRISNNQQGFGIVETLLILIIIGMVGGVGWCVWSNRSGQNQNTNSSINSFKECVDAGNTILESNPAQCIANGKTYIEENNKVVKYLELSEVGIKFELNDKIQDAEYFKDRDYYYFSVKSFQNQEGLKGCAVGGQNKNLGVVALVDAKAGEKNSTSDTGEVWTQAAIEKSGMVKAGDRYYGFMRGNGICYTEAGLGIKKNQELVESVISEFQTQMKTITKIEE